MSPLTICFCIRNDTNLLFPNIHLTTEKRQQMGKRIILENKTILMTTTLQLQCKCYVMIMFIRPFLIIAPCYISHYENAHIYRCFPSVKIENFHWKHFDIFKVSAQNIHCGYMLKAEAVLTSTNNVYLG